MQAIWCFVFFFNDTATTEIYTLSLHDALPIFRSPPSRSAQPSSRLPAHARDEISSGWQDRKSTRLNSSHANISYAVFCLKKKKKIVHMLSYKNLPSMTLLHASYPHSSP